MRRFILPRAPDAEGRVALAGKDYRYIARVLRLGPGDDFRALLPDGNEALLTIRGATSTELTCVVRSGSEEISPEAGLDLARRGALEALPSIVLLQALPKGSRMDLVVRQAAESGVALILPFVSERSVPRIAGESDAEAKRGRWERIVREARQQSGSAVDTRVSAPVTLSRAIASWRDYSVGFARSVAILLHQDPLAQGSFHGYLSGNPDAVAVAIGPEGGFTLGEAEAMVAAGFRPLLVGANVLRTETAALFATAAVQTVLLEKTSWMLRPPDSPASNA
ncbi:MAG: hypothetical protein A2Z99_15475 [Treponema sp. GWB1_62_6]|nr:MAG: hypothetical protein A2Z99_15475 [Treponema sp. GWB1_62_6]